MASPSRSLVRHTKCQLDITPKQMTLITRTAEPRLGSKLKRIANGEHLFLTARQASDVMVLMNP